MTASLIARAAFRTALVLIGVAFVTLVVLLPLATVFEEAFRKGWSYFAEAVSEPDAVASIRLTLHRRRQRRCAPSGSTGYSRRGCSMRASCGQPISTF